MRHIHRLLQQCLDQAIRDGLLTENPAKAFRYRKSTTVKANIMTPLEMEDYLDAAERLGYLPMFMLALTTGLRQGELIALKWSDLDIESRTLTIAEKRAVERRELVEYGSQTRSIRLTQEVVDLLIMLLIIFAPSFVWRVSSTKKANSLPSTILSPAKSSTALNWKMT